MITAAVFGEIKNGKSVINNSYIDHLSLSGVTSKILYDEDACEVAERYDLLMVCGGGDIDPSLYGQQPIEGIRYDRNFDIRELKYIIEFLNKNKPVLGICRGMQSINVALGGTLLQDIPLMLGLTHSKNTDHEIKISKTSNLHRSMGLRAIVNSRHHQCIDSLGKTLYVAARSHDGIIEAIESNKYPILGVQWHPERMSGNTVFDHFIKKYIKVGF